MLFPPNYCRRRFALPVLLALYLLVGNNCHKHDSEEDIETLKKEALTQYAAIVLAGYEDSYNTAELLRLRIEAFLQSPTQSGFELCKTAWLDARLPYGQTEAFRFYGGPIDDANGPEGFLNGWPVDESFIDYVVGNPNAGIINNPSQTPTIDRNLLMGLNELFSEESIFTGYHPVEFLLWGQDMNADGPGMRPYTDYLTDGTGTAAHQDRRAQYLSIVASLIPDNLAYVRDQWTTNGAYRQKFLNEFETKKSIGLIFSGMGEFTSDELPGERMFVAIDLKDQEHEHSCFSDNTLNDLKMNILGVKNVYMGAYTRVDGTVLTGRSFYEVAKKIAPEKAEAAKEALDDAIAKIDAIPAPFDQTILYNPAPVSAAIASLHQLSDRLIEVGKAIGGEF